LCIPPKTILAFRPASRATLTNCTSNPGSFSAGAAAWAAGDPSHKTSANGNTNAVRLSDCKNLLREKDKYGYLWVVEAMLQFVPPFLQFN